jgi:hypothetical protein
MVTDPACLALEACGATLGATDNATALLASFLDNADRCDDTLAYFKSQGSCGSVAYDAGAWTGLLPVQGDGGAPSSQGSASH